MMKQVKKLSELFNEGYSQYVAQKGTEESLKGHRLSGGEGMVKLENAILTLNAKAADYLRTAFDEIANEKIEDAEVALEKSRKLTDIASSGLKMLSATLL